MSAETWPISDGVAGGNWIRQDHGRAMRSGEGWLETVSPSSSTTPITMMLRICRWLERARLNSDHPDPARNAAAGPASPDPARRTAGQHPRLRLSHVHAPDDETRLVQPEPVILVEGILIFAERTLRERSTSRSSSMPIPTSASSAG